MTIPGAQGLFFSHHSLLPASALAYGRRLTPLLTISERSRQRPPHDAGLLMFYGGMVRATPHAGRASSLSPPAAPTPQASSSFATPSPPSAPAALCCWRRLTSSSLPSLSHPTGPAEELPPHRDAGLHHLLPRQLPLDGLRVRAGGAEAAHPAHPSATQAQGLTPRPPPFLRRRPSAAAAAQVLSRLHQRRAP